MSSGKISDLAGAWDLDGKKAKALLRNLRKWWKKWKVRHA